MKRLIAINISTGFVTEEHIQMIYNNFSDNYKNIPDFVLFAETIEEYIPGMNTLDVKSDWLGFDVLQKYSDDNSYDRIMLIGYGNSFNKSRDFSCSAKIYNAELMSIVEDLNMAEVFKRMYGSSRLTFFNNFMGE